MTPSLYCFQFSKSGTKKTSNAIALNSEIAGKYFHSEKMDFNAYSSYFYYIFLGNVDKMILKHKNVFYTSNFERRCFNYFPLF